MPDEVWGGVKHWGLKDQSDGSPVFSVDPVCGRKVDEAKAAGKTGYAGTLFYFCSKECQKNFEQGPGNYLGQPHLPTRLEIDVNTATAEELRSVFQIDEDKAGQILQNRPYRSWAEFTSKNPGFSDVMSARLVLIAWFGSVKQSQIGIVISRSPAPLRM